MKSGHTPFHILVTLQPLGILMWNPWRPRSFSIALEESGMRGAREPQRDGRKWQTMTSAFSCHAPIGSFRESATCASICDSIEVASICELWDKRWDERWKRRSYWKKNQIYFYWPVILMSSRTEAHLGEIGHTFSPFWKVSQVDISWYMSLLCRDFLEKGFVKSSHREVYFSAFSFLSNLLCCKQLLARNRVEMEVDPSKSNRRSSTVNASGVHWIEGWTRPSELNAHSFLTFARRGTESLF